ncbi:DUF4405 domain-containing protein [Desulfocurvus sp. DL9XJH121]
MRLRRVTSLTALSSFLVLTLTSVVLYIAPHGRVAYWSDWRFWGLSKDAWGEVHLNVGVLFLLAAGLHLWLNWGPVTTYLRDRARNFRFFTAECNVALALCALFTVGTLAEAPPFSWIVDAGEHIKERASRVHGEPPYGHAELSTLAGLAKKTDLDLDAALAALDAAGYTGFGPDAVLIDVARANNVSPREAFQAMGGGRLPDVGAGLPETPPAGTGNLTVAELCATYGLDKVAILKALDALGITGGNLENRTLKALGKDAGKHPEDIYALIRKAALSPAAP